MRVGANTGLGALGLVSVPSVNSFNEELQGLSPRSTESGWSLRLFVRASQLSEGSGEPVKLSLWRALLCWLLQSLASWSVTTYDLLMRVVMPASWYMCDLDKYSSAHEYLMARAEKKTRRYVNSALDKFMEGLCTGQIHVQNKACLDEEDFAFARAIFCGKHGKPWILYAAWRAFVTLLAAAPYCASFTTVVDGSSGAVLAVYVEYRQGEDMHHFITALVDHEASKQYGIYVAKYEQMLSACIQDGVHILRLGPTTDALKASLGAVRLPLFVVSSPVWVHFRQRCSVVAFGIFTTIGVFVYLWLTQWQMDGSGLGRLTPSEYGLLYLCCMAFVKTLPLCSIGWNKVLRNPRKYLLQTSFYAQGVVFGGVLFIAITAWTRKANPLLLLDGLCMFAFVGDCIGRLGCHWYGCCFGRPLQPTATAVHSEGATSSLTAQPFNRWSVVYLHKDSSVLRLRPELRLQPLLPTQLLQAAFAAVCQALVVHAMWRTPTMKAGLIGCFVLGMYSLGRTLFFLVREDEKFKSVRSYTTAYIALGTLGLCGVVSVYVALWSDTLTTFNLQYRPPTDSLVSYTFVACVTATVNMLVQGLHHHESVGRFPDLSALLAAPPAMSGLFAPLSKVQGQRSTPSQRSPTQVWSNWQGMGPGAYGKSE